MPRRRCRQDRSHSRNVDVSSWKTPAPHHSHLQTYHRVVYCSVGVEPLIKRLITPFTRPFNRRLDHIEVVVNARSEEAIAAVGALHSEIQRIADANEALAMNVSEIIESHLRIHAESMIALGEVVAKLDRASASTAAQAADSEPASTS